MSQEEDEYWAGKILEARRSQLDVVRKAATAWSAVFTGILGISGTVTFVGGLNGLNDLSNDIRTYVQIGIAVAAVLTFTATVLAALAANAFPVVSNNLTVDSFQIKNKERAKVALTRLRFSLGFAAAAAIVVLAGSAVVLFFEKPQDEPKTPVVVAVVNGKAYCGPLRTEGDALSVGGQALVSVTTLTIVPSCP